MKQKLYLPIRRFSLRYSYYIYFDAKEYLADQMFIRHKVRVWFGEELVRPDSPYRIIFCHVRKRDVSEFLAALEDLKKSMLICGYSDYESKVSEMLNELDQMKHGIEISENDPRRSKARQNRVNAFDPETGALKDTGPPARKLR